MDELRFDTGIKTYKVNDACEISFNPADAAFVHRLYDTLDKLSNIQDSVKPDDMEPAELWKYTSKKDAEIRTIIDSLFGEGKSAALFPNVSTFALAGGMPLWANFLFAILGEIDSSVKAQMAESDKRIKALNVKYGGYLKKYGKTK